MSLTRVMCVLSLILLMPLTAIHAQPAGADLTEDQADEDQGSEEQTSEEQNVDEQNNDDQQAAADAALPDIDSQPIDGSQNQGPGRFIPSEQISQDSGVSFPVDI